MIEYLYQEGVKACSVEPLKVRLDGKIVGEIRKLENQFNRHNQQEHLVRMTMMMKRLTHIRLN